MGIRTPDLLIANETLYQLSYTPTCFKIRHLQRFFTLRLSLCPPILSTYIFFMKKVDEKPGAFEKVGECLYHYKPT